MDSFGKRPDEHRLFSAELAGGPLLDLGPYPLVWVSTAVQLPLGSLERETRQPQLGSST